MDETSSSIDAHGREQPAAPDWWLASNGRWYPPNLHPTYRPPSPPPPSPPFARELVIPERRELVIPERRSRGRIVAFVIVGLIVLGTLVGVVRDIVDSDERSSASAVHFEPVANGLAGCELWWREIRRIVVEGVDDSIAIPRLSGVATAVENADPQLASDIRYMAQRSASSSTIAQTQSILRMCTSVHGWSGPTQAEIATVVEAEKRNRSPETR